MGITLARAEHECPDESGNVEFILSFDRAVFLGVVFEHRRWKERSEPIHNSGLGGIVVHTRFLLTTLSKSSRQTAAVW